MSHVTRSSTPPDGSVNTAQLAAGGVTNAKIGTGAVDTAQLAASAVTSAKIGSGAVTNAKLGTGAVDTAQLATSAVTGAKIGSGAVTSGKIGANQVQGGHIQAGSQGFRIVNVNEVTNAATLIDTEEVQFNSAAGRATAGVHLHSTNNDGVEFHPHSTDAANLGLRFMLANNSGGSVSYDVDWREWVQADA